MLIKQTSELATSHNPSPNANERQRPISMLVFHYTGMNSAEEAIQRLTSENSGVSAHYLINEAGHIMAMVDESLRAWHAGVGSWRGVADINSASIGIELVNPGHDFGYRSFPTAQMTSLLNLSHDLMKRYTIPAWNIVGHSDIAPQRKKDPGELFPWKWLADQGVGVWPSGGTLLPLEEVDPAFRKIGYDSHVLKIDPEAVIIAFQRRFRPHLIDGILDDECRCILGGLLDMIPIDLL